MKSYIRRIAEYSMVGGIGLAVVVSIQGCSDSRSTQNTKASSIQSIRKEPKPSLITIKQVSTNPDYYEVVGYSASGTGHEVMVVDKNGNRFLMSDYDLTTIALNETQRVLNGDSRLAKPVNKTTGLSRDEAILVSATAALVGVTTTNQLLKNNNFKQHFQRLAALFPRMISEATSTSTASYSSRNYYSSSTPTPTTNPTPTPVPTASRSNTSDSSSSSRRSGFFGDSSSSSSSSSRSGGYSSGG